MKEDVQQSAIETAGDPAKAEVMNPDSLPPPSGGISDLGTKSAGAQDANPSHHRLAKSVSAPSSADATNAAATPGGAVPVVQQGGR